MKSRKGKLTVTVGIPAYNESGNIAHLLDSVINQKQEGFKICEIIVISDGSLDNTVDIVKRFVRKSKIIKVIKHSKRLGKKTRLLEIYKKNKSDILIICDGDIVLGTPYVIEKMLGYFDEGKVVMVSGNNQPVPPENFAGRLLYAWSKVWYEVRRDYKNGNNVHNVKSSIMAIRSPFEKRIKFDKDILSDGQFIYFTIIEKSLKFRFANDAKVLFRIPDNINDFFLQNSRLSGGKRKIAQVFGTWIYDEYKIPNSYKVKALIKMIVRDPFYTLLAGLFFIWNSYLRHKKNSLDKKGFWEIALSTKKGISNMQFEKKF